MTVSPESESPPAPTRALVVGIGNEFRGDDAVGLHIARRIRNAGLEGIAVREEAGDIGTLIESWRSVGLVILVDAVRSGARPGTIFRFDSHAQPIPRVFVPHVSSHGVGLVEAIELAQVLDQLPPRLIVYGIEGDVFDTASGLSPHVERAVAEAAERILHDLPHGRQST